MRRLLLSISILALITSGLYFAQKSSAAVSTTIAPAGTPLSTQNSPSWKYGIKASNCSRSANEPYAYYTIDITTTGDYTFTMTTNNFPAGVPGRIHVYRSVFSPDNPCTNIANNLDSNGNYITGSPLTLTLSASANGGRYVVVFTATNIVNCPNCPNQSITPSNVNGTFSATVSGPAAVTRVQNVTTTIAGSNTPLNYQNNYTWNYPIKLTDCPSSPGAVPFAVYELKVTSTGLYTFTMNASGFDGVIHLYKPTFNPNNPCENIANNQDQNGDIITGNSVAIPIDIAFSEYVTIYAVFSARSAGTGGTFSASVTGPGAVTLMPPGDLRITSQPTSKTVTKGCVQTLTVFAAGPLPQTFQWYEGIDGDLTNSILIPGATSNTYVTPPLTSNKSYWVRVSNGNDHVDSNTFEFKVYETNKTPFSGSLDTNQTWQLMTTYCNPSNTLVNYGTTLFRAPTAGNYTVRLNRASNFTGNYTIHIYDSSFNATNPCMGFYSVSANQDLTTFLQAGNHYIVISGTSPNEGAGSYSGTISSVDDCSLPETIEQALLISGNPLDKAIAPGGTATLTFAYTGGSGMAKSVRWYKGFSGDTSQPISGATLTSYTTPALNQSPPNQPTYYYYWARVTDPGQGTHADTRTAIVNVLNPPITYSDVLSTCDEVYPQVNGPVTYYKIFPFTVSTSGQYTFNVNASGFTPTVRLYQGFFSPNFPNINYYGPGSTQNLLAGPNTYYLVITSTASNKTGSFTLTINGPSLVVPTPRPIITTQPTDKIIFRGQTTTLNVGSSTPDVSYQWFTGNCTNKTAISGANANSYTTPPLTDYQDYWVKVSYGVMYVNSNIAHVRIRPQAIADSYIIDEDTTLNVDAPGILANDLKADSKTLTAFKVSDPTLGSRNLNSNGALTYSPRPNINGPDLFQYKVSDGTLESAPADVAILVLEVNDTPVRTGGSLNDHTFNEDAPVGILNLGGLNYGPGGGTDEATQQLTYTVTVVPPAGVGAVVLSDDTTVVTANTSYTLAQIRGMKFKPAPNGQGGPYPFTFTVTDNGTTHGLAAPQTLTQSLNITVNPVADTPTVTPATTDEDTMTASGLVLSRNSGDGAEVGYFKIGPIRNGTLYKSDGTTQINADQFITYAEGQAGLKFKPNANLFSPTTTFNFEVQASLTNSIEGLGGSVVTVAVTVNPVAELPSITGAATFVNLQTASGLVITRNPTDGAEIGHYKISSIANGTLYKADGTTQISEGEIITVADGTAGLKFTPAQDSPATGSFNVQGSADTSGSGLGPAATANIAVSKYATSTTIKSATPPAPTYLGQQVTVNFGVVNNISGGPSPTGDVVVTVSGGTETCTGTATAGSCTLTLTEGGNPRTITAAYSGNNQFESSSGTKDHIVNGCTQNTVVNSKEDDGSAGSLRYILTNACEGSTVTFDPTVFDPASGPHVITLATFANLSGNLLINKNLTIKGPGANFLTVRRNTALRTPRFRIFNIAEGVTVNISGLTLSNGNTNTSAEADGGGILNSGTLTLDSCVISGNQAGRDGLSSGSGGGIYNKGSLTIINSTISDNNAFIGSGGGLFVENGGTANIINSTISGNKATVSGGGLAVSGSAKLVNSTVTNNTGNVSGGGIYNTNGTTTIGNSIVAVNTSATGPDVLLLSGNINTSGHNLIGKNNGGESIFPSGSPNVNADLVGTLDSPVLPLLGSLADNGGTTQTHLPLPGSPAIDVGSNDNLPQDTFDLDGDGDTIEPLPVDQRGQTRTANNAVDIGAVEAGFSIGITSGAGQSAVINSSFAVPFQATVTESGVPRSGISVTFTAPDSGASGTFNGDLTATVITDSSGVATAPAFTANEVAGGYNVSANLSAVSPAVNFSVTNTPGQAQIILGNLTQNYDGTPKSVSVTTIPSGLSVTLTYNGSATPPSNAGAYEVSALINDANYVGQTTSTFNIGKASQAIDFGALPDKTFGDAPFTLNATATSGLPVSLTVVSGPATINANTITITGAGTVTVAASQGGNENYLAAPDVQHPFTVNKAKAIITLSNLSYTYDGSPRAVTATTVPAGLSGLSVTYDGSPTAPSNAGNYSIVALLVNDNYQAANVTDMLTINRATPVINWNNPASITEGTPLSEIQLNAVANVAGSFSYTPAAGSLLGAGSHTLTADFTPSDAVNYNSAQTLVQLTVYAAASPTPTPTPTPAPTPNVTPTPTPSPTPTPTPTPVSTPTPTPTPPVADTIQFSQSSYAVNENDANTQQGFASLSIEVTRSGGVSSAATVHYTTTDQSGGNECNQITGQASQRCDYAIAVGTLRFAAGESIKQIQIPIINDGYVEGAEFFTIRLENAIGVELGANSQATISIQDDDIVATTGANNPYLGNEFFVRMNYLDFLSREPDTGGFTDWAGVLNNCGSQKGFLGAMPECDRAHVSHGFFGSPEFTNTVFVIYRIYEVGMGRLPRYSEFTPDIASLSGFGISDAIKQQNLEDYLQQFTSKAEFTNRFSDALQPSQAATLIQKLEQSAGVTLPATAATNPGQAPQYGRQELINLRAAGTLTLGQTLKAFVEQQPVYDKFFPRGHVTILYFAYLKRDPDLNDPNLVGWNDWVDVFTNGRASAGIAPRDIHHLIFGFIYSEEYRKRFGAP